MFNHLMNSPGKTTVLPSRLSICFVLAGLIFLILSTCFFLFRISIYVAIVGLALILLGIGFLPIVLEKRLNKITTPPPYRVSEEAAKLHHSLFVADMHADSLLFNRNLLRTSNYGHVDIPRLIKGNVGLQAFIVVTRSPYSLNIHVNDGKNDIITLLSIISRWPISCWWSLKARALYQGKKLQNFALRSNGQLIIIRSTSDLDSFKKQRDANPQMVAGFLGLEGAHALEGDIRNVDFLYNAGFRMIGLTHFGDNEVAGSAHGIKKGGLTTFGRQVVKRIEELNMLIDLSHSSPQTIDDVLSISTRPLIVSHTGVKGILNNERNLTDEQIKKIAEKDGVICICYWNTAIGGGDAKAVVRSIRYVTDLVGIEHVGIGSDFDGAITAPFDSSGVGMVTETLLMEGFSESEIRLIMGENIMRLLRSTLPAN